MRACHNYEYNYFLFRFARQELKEIEFSVLQAADRKARDWCKTAGNPISCTGVDWTGHRVTNFCVSFCATFSSHSRRQRHREEIESLRLEPHQALESLHMPAWNTYLRQRDYIVLFFLFLSAFIRFHTRKCMNTHGTKLGSGTGPNHQKW